MTHVYRVRPGKREDFWEGKKRDGVVRRGMVRELAKGWFDGYEGVGGVVGGAVVCDVRDGL